MPRKARMENTIRSDINVTPLVDVCLVVFFAADGNLPYERVADFMDLCRDNGARNLGIVFEELGG